MIADGSWPGPCPRFEPGPGTHLQGLIREIASLQADVGRLERLLEERDGPRLPKRRHPWTEEELATLRRVYVPGATRDEVMAHFPGRKWVGVRTQAYKMGLTIKEEERE